MDAQRRSELVRSLEHQLEGEAREDHRLEWLAARLEEYVDRWVGCMLPSWSVVELIDGDGFGAIEIGSAALEREIRSSVVADRAIRNWEYFVGKLAEVKEDPNRELAAELLNAVQQVRISPSVIHHSPQHCAGGHRGGVNRCGGAGRQVLEHRPPTPSVAAGE